jgi:hypothetical protein
LVVARLVRISDIARKQTSTAALKINVNLRFKSLDCSSSDRCFAATSNYLERGELAQSLWPSFCRRSVTVRRTFSIIEVFL